MDSFFASVMMFSMVLRFFWTPKMHGLMLCSNHGLSSPKNDKWCWHRQIRQEKGHEENRHSLKQWCLVQSWEPWSSWILSHPIPPRILRWRHGPGRATTTRGQRPKKRHLLRAFLLKKPRLRRHERWSHEKSMENDRKLLNWHHKWY